MNINAIVGLLAGDQRTIQESVGVTKQVAGEDDSWHQTIGGLIFQGGIVAGDNPGGDATGASVPFIYPFPAKVLGIWITFVGNNAPGAGEKFSIAVHSYTLADFKISNDSEGPSFYFWLAIGY
jgi:hypothetical protein